MAPMFMASNYVIMAILLIGVGVFVPVFFVITNYLEYNENVFQFIPHLVLFSLMGIMYTKTMIIRTMRLNLNEPLISENLPLISENLM